MNKNVEQMLWFEKEKYEKSLSKSSQNCSHYLDSFCCRDLDSGRVWYCNNGNPCIVQKEGNKWQGCEKFDEK